MKNILEKALDVVDKASKVPGKLARLGEDTNNPDLTEFGYYLNDQVIQLATSIDNAQKQSAAIAEQNIKETKINSIGRNIAQWMQEPVNLIFAAAGLVLTIVLIRKI